MSGTVTEYRGWQIVQLGELLWRIRPATAPAGLYLTRAFYDTGSAVRAIDFHIRHSPQYLMRAVP